MKNNRKTIKITFRQRLFYGKIALRNRRRWAHHHLLGAFIRLLRPAIWNMAREYERITRAADPYGFWSWQDELQDIGLSKEDTTLELAIDLLHREPHLLDWFDDAVLGDKDTMALYRQMTAYFKEPQ